MMRSRNIIAIFVFFAFMQAQSQVTFKPGFRAGVNFSHFTKGDDFDDQYYYAYDSFDPNIQYTSSVEFSNKTDFYIGFYGALHLTKYYTLQPEIDYSRQGSNVEFINNNSRSESKIDVSYLSVAVINKFTFSEKFNVHIGPTIDFVVDKSRNLSTIYSNNSEGIAIDPYYYSGYDDGVTDVDLAFVAGFGFNFTRSIGIEARIKKGIVPVMDFVSDSDHTNVTYSVGATYTFDLK